MKPQVFHGGDRELVGLAHRINERESRIEELLRQTVEHANAAVAEALLQGQDLLQAKSRVPYGLWLDWLKANCPRCERMAQNYMRVARWASDPKRVADLKAAGSLRAVLELCAGDDDHKDQDDEPKRWPAYIEAISRFTKFRGFVEKFPIAQWPSEGKDKLKEEFEPVAKQLWPEKFLP